MYAIGGGMLGHVTHASDAWIYDKCMLLGVYVWDE